jgi:hypothetical protein
MQESVETSYLEKLKATAHGITQIVRHPLEQIIISKHCTYE